MRGGDHIQSKVTFRCAACPSTAGTARLVSDGERLRVEWEGHLWWVDADRAGPVAVAFALGTAPAIHAANFEYLPAYCPQCDACYCPAHWQTWMEFDDDDRGWVDSVQGRCPRGHVRMISD